MNLRHFHFVTLFPEVIDSWMQTSILGRALQKSVFTYSTYQLRDFSTDRYRSVDDVAYGGGGGMVLRLDCLVAAVEHIQNLIAAQSKRVIYFSPSGKPLNHKLVAEYAAPGKETHLIFICGHYEGVDQRFIDGWVDEEISLGDFVLTGGELPALAFTDSLCRQLEGTLKKENIEDNESFAISTDGKALLEYPHYTRPSEFRGLCVPEVLLSGDHAKISQWRKEQSFQKTKRLRPDLLK